ncbi:MAG: DNA-3-methyladenine glycosylase I [Candidatus Bathyarchaeota archaeon]
MDKSTRCFGNKDPVMAEYHDEEWGVPLHTDNELFGLIILEGAQAGLSWRTVLHRREAYREAYAGFDPESVAGFSPKKLEDIRLNTGVIRNKLKIASAVKNAKGFLDIQREYGSFDKYLWEYVNYEPKMNAFASWKEVPAETELSQRISIDLKKRGFTFVGPTIMYAYMQSVGMVNDHLTTCFRYQQIVDEYGR